MRTLVVVELGPHVVGDTTDKHGRIKLGLTCHAQNLAVVGVEAHHGAVAGVAVTRGLGEFDSTRQRRLAGLLDLEVKRELNVGAGLGRHGAGLSGHVARGIDLNRLLAANTLQQVLVVALDTRLAHDITRLVRNLTGSAIVIARSLLVLCLELLRGNGAGITQNVTGRLAIRVLALGALGNLHARELAGMLLDIGNRGAAHVRRDGMQALSALGIVLDIAQHRNIGHTEHIGKMVHQHGVIGQVAIGDDGKRGTVLHKCHAIAIKDSPAHSRRGDGTGLVVLGLLVVVARRDHLHTPQLDGERGKHRAHAGGEDGEATLEGGRGGIALALGGARGRSMLRIVGKTGIAAAHDDQRDHNGHDQHDTGDDNRHLGRHLRASPI